MGWRTELWSNSRATPSPSSYDAELTESSGCFVLHFGTKQPVRGYSKHQSRPYPDLPHTSPANGATSTRDSSKQPKQLLVTVESQSSLPRALLYPQPSSNSGCDICATRPISYRSTTNDPVSTTHTTS